MLACPTAALCGIWLATVPLHLPPSQTLPLSLFPIDFVAVKLRREAALGDGLAGEGEGGVLHSMELTTVMGQRQ